MTSDFQQWLGFCAPFRRQPIACVNVWSKPFVLLRGDCRTLKCVWFSFARRRSFDCFCLPASPLFYELHKKEQSRFLQVCFPPSSLCFTSLVLLHEETVWLFQLYFSSFPNFSNLSASFAAFAWRNIVTVSTLPFQLSKFLQLVYNFCCFCMKKQCDCFNLAFPAFQISASLTFF